MIHYEPDFYNWQLRKIHLSAGNLFVGFAYFLSIFPLFLQIYLSAVTFFMEYLRQKTSDFHNLPLCGLEPGKAPVLQFGKIPAAKRKLFEKHRYKSPPAYPAFVYHYIGPRTTRGNPGRCRQPGRSPPQSFSLPAGNVENRPLS